MHFGSIAAYYWMKNHFFVFLPMHLLTDLLFKEYSQKIPKDMKNEQVKTECVLWQSKGTCQNTKRGTHYVWYLPPFFLNSRQVGFDRNPFWIPALRKNIRRLHRGEICWWLLFLACVVWKSYIIDSGGVVPWRNLAS